MNNIATDVASSDQMGGSNLRRSLSATPINIRNALLGDRVLQFVSMTDRVT